MVVSYGVQPATETTLPHIAVNSASQPMFSQLSTEFRILFLHFALGLYRTLFGTPNAVRMLST